MSFTTFSSFSGESLALRARSVVIADGGAPLTTDRDHRVRIRFRIDGVLHVQTEADAKIASAVALLYVGNLMILSPLGQLMRAVTALREGDLRGVLGVVHRVDPRALGPLLDGQVSEEGVLLPPLRVCLRALAAEDEGDAALEGVPPLLAGGFHELHPSSRVDPEIAAGDRVQRLRELHVVHPPPLVRSKNEGEDPGVLRDKAAEVVGYVRPRHVVLVVHEDLPRDPDRAPRLLRSRSTRGDQHLDERTTVLDGERGADDGRREEPALDSVGFEVEPHERARQRAPHRLIIPEMRHVSVTDSDESLKTRSAKVPSAQTPGNPQLMPPPRDGRK